MENKSEKTSVKSKYLVDVEGFSEGNTFFVDGPLWYDGEAHLQTYNETRLELNLKMKFPPSFGILPYKVKKGKIDLLITIEKNGDSFNMTTTDNYAEKVVESEEGLKVKHGYTDEKTGKKEFVRICNEQHSVTFIIHNPEKVTVKASRFPVGVDLIKNPI